MKTTIWKHVFEGKNKSKHLQDKVVILENVLNPVKWKERMEGLMGKDTESDPLDHRKNYKRIPEKKKKKTNYFCFIDYANAFVAV